MARLIRHNLDIRLLPGVFRKNHRHIIAEKDVHTLAREKNLPQREAMIDFYFQETFHENLGWKHALVKPIDHLKQYKICANNLSFVTITKNPYSWLLSFYRHPYHQYWRQTPDFRTFLTTPWRTVGRENAPREFSSPVELWNQKNASYIQLQQQFPTANLSYEDILSDPKRTVESIQQMSSCDWKRQTFLHVDKLPGEKNKNFLFYQKYYLEEQWKQELPSDVIGVINERVIPRLCRGTRKV